MHSPFNIRSEGEGHRVTKCKKHISVEGDRVAGVSLYVVSACLVTDGNNNNNNNNNNVLLHDSFADDDQSCSHSITFVFNFCF